MFYCWRRSRRYNLFWRGQLKQSGDSGNAARRMPPAKQNQLCFAETQQLWSDLIVICNVEEKQKCSEGSRAGGRTEHPYRSELSPKLAYLQDGNIVSQNDNLGGKQWDPRDLCCYILQLTTREQNMFSTTVLTNVKFKSSLVCSDRPPFLYHWGWSHGLRHAGPTP